MTLQSPRDNVGKNMSLLCQQLNHIEFLRKLSCLVYNNWKELGSNGTSSRALYTQLQKESGKVEETQLCKLYDEALPSSSPNKSTYIHINTHTYVYVYVCMYEFYVVTIQCNTIIISNKLLFLWPSKQWKPGCVEIPLLFTGNNFMQSVTVHKNIYSSGNDKTTINALWIYARITHIFMSIIIICV